VKIIDLNLNFDEIRKRIESDKDQYKPGIWAGHVGESINVISNIHGKAGRHNPSLQYIIAVAKFTQKPIEWYLYGETVKPLTISETPSGYGSCADSLDNWPDEIKNACRQMKKILDSDHPVIRPALLSNLAAFEYSVDKEKSQDEEIKKINKRLKRLEVENKELKGCVGGSPPLTLTPDKCAPTGTEETET